MHVFRPILFLLPLLVAGCVAPADVPVENVRATDEELLVQAAHDVLVERNLTVVSAAGGRYLESAWYGDDQQQRKVTVRISHTSRGFALATRVDLAVALEAVVAPPERVVTIQERQWAVLSPRPDAVREEEGELGHAIRERWDTLRRRPRAR